MKFDWRNNKDFWSGILLLFFGIAGFYMAFSYPFGSSLRMGPGYFPRVLAGIIIAFGLFVLIRGIRVHLHETRVRARTANSGLRAGTANGREFSAGDADLTRRSNGIFHAPDQRRLHGREHPDPGRHGAARNTQKEGNGVHRGRGIIQSGTWNPFICSANLKQDYLCERHKIKGLQRCKPFSHACEKGQALRNASWWETVFSCVVTNSSNAALPLSVTLRARAIASLICAGSEIHSDQPPMAFAMSA